MDLRVIYTELIQSFPESKMLADALFNLADIYFAAGDVNGAAQLYNHVIDQILNLQFIPMRSISSVGVTTTRLTIKVL